MIERGMPRTPPPELQPTKGFSYRPAPPEELTQEEIDRRRRHRMQAREQVRAPKKAICKKGKKKKK